MYSHIITHIEVCIHKYKYSYSSFTQMSIITNIYVHVITHKVDMHEKGIITHINVCIHKNKYSNNCTYT